jgi:hypothetical protein
VILYTDFEPKLLNTNRLLLLYGISDTFLRTLRGGFAYGFLSRTLQCEWFLFACVTLEIRTLRGNCTRGDLELVFCTILIDRSSALYY